MGHHHATGGPAVAGSLAGQVRSRRGSDRDSASIPAQRQRGGVAASSGARARALDVAPRVRGNRHHGGTGDLIGIVANLVPHDRRGRGRGSGKRKGDGVSGHVGVAIVGASGYAARELIQILLKHPGVRITVATSRQDEAPRVDALHPSLTRRIDLACEPFVADQIAERASFAFLALPHTASLAVVPALRKRNVRVIDLSADYRLSDPQVYADWYGHEHTDLAGLKQAVYGLPELFRDQIPPAQLIANPGCYTSTSILSLAPLIAEDLIERTGIIIDAKSGVSGAG